MTKILRKKKEKVNQDKMLIQNFESDILVTKEKIASAAKGKEYYKERTDGLQASIDEQEKRTGRLYGRAERSTGYTEWHAEERAGKRKRLLKR